MDRYSKAGRWDPLFGRLPAWAGLALAALAAGTLWAETPRPGSAAEPGSEPALSLKLLRGNASGNSFDFRMERIEGTIRLDGAYHGVTRLVDRRTGKQFIDSRYSAMNLFKLMSVNLAMGMPRVMERKIEASSNWVQACWAPTESHRGEIIARYALRPPDAIDLTVTLRSQGTYAGYELFLSNYFDKEMRPFVYLQPPRGKALPEGAERVLPMVSDVFRGTVLVFPRDAHAARRCVDGRWDRLEADTPTVQMCPVRRYAHCLAVMADAQESCGVALMALPRDCYAISTRYHAESEQDRMTTYSAFDLSLFGEDVVAGDQRTVKVRLQVVTLDGSFQEPVRCYGAFLAETDQGVGPLAADAAKGGSL